MFIVEPLIYNVSTDSQSYFHFLMPMPVPVWDSIFPFISAVLYLTGNRHPFQLIKVICTF